MAAYRFSSGVVHDVDLDAAGPNMREIYDQKIADGEMTLVEAPKKPAPAKKAAPSAVVADGE